MVTMVGNNTMRQAAAKRDADVKAIASKQKAKASQIGNGWFLRCFMVSDYYGNSKMGIYYEKREFTMIT